jgi:hypothetical protein
MERLEMTPQELTTAISRTLGKRQGSEFCRRLGIARSTLHRWQAGDVPIPNWVGMVMEQWKDIAEWKDKD